MTAAFQVQRSDWDMIMNGE